MNSVSMILVMGVIAVASMSQVARAFESETSDDIDSFVKSYDDYSDYFVEEPACEGTLTLPPGKIARKQGGGYLYMYKTYCHVICDAGGSQISNAKGDIGCKPKPVCVGTARLSPGESADEVKGGFSYGYKTYCRVKCTKGATLEHKYGKAVCVPKPECVGTLKLAPGKISRKVKGGFSFGYKTYCHVLCAKGGDKVTNAKGDVACKPKPVCVGIARLSPGESADKVKGGFSYGYKTYCHVRCTKGSKLEHKYGKAVCVPKPVCVGTARLSPGESADKVKGGFSYGYKTYCHVKCTEGSKFEHKYGKAVCVPKPKCVGTLTLPTGKSAEKVEGGFSHGYKIYCDIKCKCPTATVHYSGSTATCKRGGYSGDSSNDSSSDYTIVAGGDDAVDYSAFY